MLIDAARRAETAAKEMLALVNSGSVTCEEIREALAVSKTIAGVNSAFQSAAAAAVAGRERHGDGGADVLASSAGLSRQEARSHIKTAETLREAPRLRDAVESGRVSSANAKRLAEAVEKTSAADADADGDLLAKAESLRPEQFTKEARRWTVERQGDGGVSEHARQRARRCVRIWDADDGMVHLHGEFDKVTGNRIRSRLRTEAARLYDTDKKHANNTTGANGSGPMLDITATANNGSGRMLDNANSNGSDPQRRSFDQCMADALDHLSSNSGAHTSGREPFADICVVAHVDEATGELIAQLPNGERLPRAVLEELACDARLTGVIYDRKGKAIWRTHPKRRATNAQRQMLIARDGGCFACGTDPDICDVHHVRPVSQGGPTKLDNLVLACWQHHTAVHHFGWQIHGPPGNRTLHPPNHIHHGPAHTPERPMAHAPTRPAPAAPPAPTPAANHTRRHPEPAHAGTTTPGPGPAAARAALHANKPTPLFTPD